MNWRTLLQGKSSLKEPLKNHTSFKIGGKARLLLHPADNEDLKKALQLLKKHRMPFLVLGAGTNILVSDRGVQKAVIKLDAHSFQNIRVRGAVLEAGAGVWLNRLSMQAYKHGLSGGEFLSHIPGTVGGALQMNAGISDPFARGRNRRRSIGDLVHGLTVMDRNGAIKELKKADLAFGYRQSNLAGFIILSAQLRLKKKPKAWIRQCMKAYQEYRRQGLDLSRPSAGCVFKNPKEQSAGKLIDLCGLKGKQIGGACVSSKHANFILNVGCAKSKDVLQLMGLIKARVKRRFNITLEPEIKIWR